MPIHPAAVHFPIAFIVLSVLADWVGAWRNSRTLTATGWWAMLAAAIGSAIAAGTGLIDRTRPSIGPSVMSVVNLHMYIGLSVLAATIVLSVWRWRFFKAEQAPGWAYRIIGAGLVAVVLYQGRLGGELVYVYGVS
jgi:uncharacterized membrane protein